MDLREEDEDCAVPPTKKAKKSYCKWEEARNTSEVDDQVIKAEVKMTMLCAKTNASFSFYDEFTRSVADMFPNSAIAQSYSAGETKATQLIKAIAMEFDDDVTSICKAQPFSLLCGESNDESDETASGVILARIYDESNLEVTTKFLDMPICNVDNSEDLYEKLSQALSKRGIPWENLIAFNCDNASVMKKDRHNSVISRIHRLERDMCRLIRRFLGYLIPPRAIMDVPLKEVNYGPGHQLADEALFIGEQMRAFIQQAELPVSTRKKIFRTVRVFYEAVLRKMFACFPIDSQLLKDLTVLDPASRLDITPSTVTRLGALFPQLSFNLDGLREELIDYQVTGSKELPQEDRIDRFWGLLGKDLRFSELTRLMKALLCIPHSNASSERLFSVVKKTVTENMALDNSTLCALLSCKINYTGLVHKYTPSQKVLRNARSATYTPLSHMLNVSPKHPESDETV